MNLSEFKAWFKGFTESMDGPPSEKAWARIKKQVNSITPEPTKIEHIHHSYPWIRERYWWPHLTRVAVGSKIATSVGTNTTSMLSPNATPSPLLSVDTGALFAEIGREEAKALGIEKEAAE